MTVYVYAETYDEYQHICHDYWLECTGVKRENVVDFVYVFFPSHMIANLFLLKKCLLFFIIGSLPPASSPSVSKNYIF